MLNSPIIEVIIGLIFVYSLLSILVTQINTVIGHLVNARARHLQSAIADMLTDSVVRAKFMAHPLVRLIHPEIQPDDEMSAQAASEIAETEPREVDWIPPELFSQALLDILSANAGRSMFDPLFITAEQVLNGAEKAQMRELIRRLQNSGIGVGELRNAINNLADPNDRTAMLNALGRVEAMRLELHANNEGSKLIPLLEGVRHIEDPFLRKALETLLASARSIEEAQAKIEFWFNARMDQLTAIYRRNMQFLSLAIGILLTLSLNVDSLVLARTFWDDPAVRQTVVLSAEQLLTSGTLEQEIERSGAALDSVTSPTPMPDLSEGAPPPPQTLPEEFSPLELATDEQARARANLELLLSLRLPISWEFTPVPGGCPQETTVASIVDPCDNLRNLWNLIPGNNPNWPSLWIRKLAGWFLTVIAIAQGAPFWFDLLNRIARGRSGS
ncbi:MAG: hypothetical protein SNJ59_08875 [Aggregatilineales bacterium]